MGSKLQTASFIAAAGVASGAVGVAQFSVAAGIVVVIAASLDFGYATEWSRRVAASRQVRHDVQRAVRGISVRALAAAGFGSASAAVWFEHQGISLGYEALLAVGIWTAAALLANGLNLLQQGLGNFRDSSMIAGAVRTIAAVFGLALATRVTVGQVLVICAVAETLISLAFCCSMVRQMRDMSMGVGKWEIGTSTPTQSHVWLGIGSLTNTLINKSDVLIVAMVAGSLGTATYAIASQVQNAVTTLALAPAAATMTFVARESVKTSAPRLARLVSRTAGMVAVVAAVVSIAVASTAVVVVKANLGIAQADDLRLASLAIGICLIAAPFSVAAATHLSASIGLAGHRKVAQSWLVTAVITVPLLLALTYTLSAVGAALAALVRDLILLVLARRLWLRTLSETLAEERVEVPRSTVSVEGVVNVKSS